MTTVNETFVFRGSSHLNTASYEPDVENLTIEFSDGSSYIYYSVPASVYRGLTLAGSAGGYFERHIKGRYAYDPA